MARTRWQRRRTVATATDRLRFAAVILAIAVVGLDLALGGVVPLTLVVIAASYVFIEGCYRVSVLVARQLFH
jgi:hypothetical protein